MPGFLIPTALSSEIDDNGIDHIHAAYADAIMFNRNPYVPPPDPNQWLAVSVTGTSGLTFFPWTAEGGFGTPVSPSLFNGLGAAGGNGFDVRFHPTGSAVAVAHANSPFVSIWPVDDTLGLQPKLANPSPTPGSNPNSLAFTSSGNALAINNLVTTFGVYASTSSAVLGSVLDSQAISGSGASVRLAFTPDNANIIQVTQSGTRIYAYPWDGTNIGTQYSNPPVAIPGLATDVCVSPDGNFIFVSHANAPFVTAYRWNNGFVEKMPDPVTPMTNRGTALAMNSTGTRLVVGQLAAPFVVAYEWSEDGFGAKLPDPSTALPAFFFPAGLSFSRHDDAIAVVSNAPSSGPYLYAYSWSDAGFGTRYTAPPSSTKITRVAFF